MVFFIITCFVLSLVWESDCKVLSIDTQGLCNNTKDLGVIESFSESDFHWKLRDIGESCEFSHDQDTCLFEKISALGFSDGCTSCFTYDALCTGKNCILSCGVDPTSNACFKCQDKYCTPTFYDCSGVVEPRKF